MAAIAMDKARIGSKLGAAALLALAAAAAGCADPVRPGARPGKARISREMAREINKFADEAARKAQRCYRAPRVASVGRLIVTHLRVRYAANGSVIGLPTILSQTGVTAVNRVYAGRMAEAARLAVIRCSPVVVPPKLSRQPWNELDLVFAPSRRV
jgi:hypothetical protein